VISLPLKNQDSCEGHADRLPLGGKAIDGPGHFWEPTVITDLNEEPFGPVAPVVSFDTTEEALALANRVPFGLASYVFTSSLATARTTGELIEAGMVGINDNQIMGPESPFGGVKDSGYGSESGIEGLEAFMYSKYIRET
jgi:succinate-semialdehyde dehydrogenase/glutarate-semialdehyde dehydrogenase